MMVSLRDRKHVVPPILAMKEELELDERFIGPRGLPESGFQFRTPGQTTKLIAIDDALVALEPSDIKVVFYQFKIL